MADIAIFCVREDQSAAEAIARMFDDAGLSVIGAPLDDEGFRSVAAGVLVLSAASLRSAAFLDAAERIVSLRKAVIASRMAVPRDWDPACPAFDLTRWNCDPSDPILDPLYFAVDRLIHSSKDRALIAATDALDPLFIEGVMPVEVDSGDADASRFPEEEALPSTRPWQKSAPSDRPERPPNWTAASSLRSVLQAVTVAAAFAAFVPIAMLATRALSTVDADANSQLAALASPATGCGAASIDAADATAASIRPAERISLSREAAIDGAGTAEVRRAASGRQRTPSSVRVAAVASAPSDEASAEPTPSTAEAQLDVFGALAPLEEGYSVLDSPIAEPLLKPFDASSIRIAQRLLD